MVKTNQVGVEEGAWPIEWNFPAQQKSRQLQDHPSRNSPRHPKSRSRAGKMEPWKGETRTPPKCRRPPQGPSMRTNQAEHPPQSRHSQLSRDPGAFFRTISLPIYQILHPSSTTVRVEKLPDSIYRTLINQMREL